MEQNLSGLLEDLEAALFDESRALYDHEVEEIRNLTDEWEEAEWEESTGLRYIMK